mmetsp:Transcript_60235/g.113669  ORF Transcript_60235/g.113669 Transcript_60235/m.113669 type:complete len:310 (-) Transcript_60235:249-1178(-)
MLAHCASESLNCLASFFSCFSAFSAAWRCPAIELFVPCSVSTSCSSSAHFSNCHCRESSDLSTSCKLSIGSTEPSCAFHLGRNASSWEVCVSSLPSSCVISLRSSSSCCSAARTAEPFEPPTSAEPFLRSSPADDFFLSFPGGGGEAETLPPVSSPRPFSIALDSLLLLRLSAFASASASAEELPAFVVAEPAFAVPFACCVKASRKPRSRPKLCKLRTSSARVVNPCLWAESRSLWKTLRKTNCGSERVDMHTLLRVRSKCCRPKNHFWMCSFGTARSNVRSGKRRLKQHQGGSSKALLRWKVVVMGP